MMIGIIVLCRFNSSRLPGKILKVINGKPILAYILERLSLLGDKYRIVVCTSEEKTDNPIAEYCDDHGVLCFRGDLDNVASRFLTCAKHFGFDIAVRINGDNLFADPGVIELVIEEMERKKYDFVSNVQGRTFPRGMSVEAVQVSVYEKYYHYFSDRDREHVMTFFYTWNEGRKHYVMNPEPIGSGMNMAIDTPEDFDRASRIVALMKEPHTSYSYKDIVNLYKTLN